MNGESNGSMSRRGAMAAGLGLLTLGAAAAAQNTPAPSSGSAPTDAPKPTKKPKPAPLDSAMVREFVGAAHSDLEKTRAMLEREPGLLNATWDWGAGDFETALGGASHMGRPDIAAFLIEKGARMDLFAAAMLGKLEIIKAAVGAFPGIEKAPGPHDIPLLSHAEQGGENARPVLEYLKSIGA